MENFAQAVESVDSAGESGGGESLAAAEEMRRQQDLVAALETTISGAKLRYAAMLFLYESRSASATSGGSCIGFNVIDCNKDREAVNSILQTRFDWLPLPSSLTDESPTTVATMVNTKSKNKSKGKTKIKDSTTSSSSDVMGGRGSAAKDLRVCSIPPAFAPIPCKPVFYDVALNHLDLTGEGSAETGSPVSRDIDRRCGLQVKVTSGSKGKSVGRGQQQPDERGEDVDSSAGASTLVGAAAQSIYGWWSGGDK